nr:MAG TPA: hypothetical protein [Caudoviricetes sp.]
MMRSVCQQKNRIFETFFYCIFATKGVKYLCNI